MDHCRKKEKKAARVQAADIKVKTPKKAYKQSGLSVNFEEPQTIFLFKRQSMWKKERLNTSRPTETVISNTSGPWGNMMVHFFLWPRAFLGQGQQVDMPTHAQLIGGEQLITATMVLQQLMWYYCGMQRMQTEGKCTN